MKPNNHLRTNTMLLCTLVLLGMVMFSCRVKRIGTTQGSSKDKAIESPNKKANVPIDTLISYKGPIDTFASYQAYQSYLNRERNLIRETPLGDFPSDIYIKMPDGSIQETTDVSRAGYHTKINNDSVPLFLRNLLPDAEFYYAKLNMEPSEYRLANSNPADIICRINGKNYMVPNEVNIIFDETSKKEVSIEEKIEFIISLRHGLNTNYKILSIVPKEVKIGPRLSNYETTFLLDNKKYVGYLGLINKNEIDFLYINEENGKGKGILLMYGSKFSY